MVWLLFLHISNFLLHLANSEFLLPFFLNIDYSSVDLATFYSFHFAHKFLYNLLTHRWQKTTAKLLFCPAFENTLYDVRCLSQNLNPKNTECIWMDLQLFQD